ncbi:MAG: TetR/AcrR family transcriptional regulator [Flavisolibacter sp.]|nr:TetR/AcrR family transcriptional regulator [Flavisolibacter sp.]
MRIKDESKTDLIFKATLNLVKERGLAGITMNDISKAASIATGTLYIYFKNKEELIKALFLECRTVSVQHYFAGLQEISSFEGRMKRLFINIITYKIAFFEVSAFLEQSYHSPFVCIADLKKKEKALKPLFALVKEGIEAGKLKNADEELIISYLFGIIHEMVKKTYFSGKKLSPETIEQLYDMFWDGVRRQ